MTKNSFLMIIVVSFFFSIRCMATTVLENATVSSYCKQIQYGYLGKTEITMYESTQESYEGGQVPVMRELRYTPCFCGGKNTRNIEMKNYTDVCFEDIKKFSEIKAPMLSILKNKKLNAKAKLNNIQKILDESGFMSRFCRYSQAQKNVGKYHEGRYFFECVSEKEKLLKSIENVIATSNNNGAKEIAEKMDIFNKLFFNLIETSGGVLDLARDYVNENQCKRNDIMDVSNLEDLLVNGLENPLIPEGRTPLKASVSEFDKMRAKFHFSRHNMAYRAILDFTQKSGKK